MQKPEKCEYPDCASPPYMIVTFRDCSTAWMCIEHCREAAGEEISLRNLEPLSARK